MTEFELVYDENGIMQAVKRQQIKIAFKSDIAMLEAIELIGQRIPESKDWDVNLINIKDPEWFNDELNLIKL